MVLAQLVDVLPDWAWTLLNYGGLAAPISGVVLRALLYRAPPVHPRGAITILFYAVTLPEFFLLKHGTESLALVCSYLMFMPFGFMLGLLCVFPLRRRK